jgi:ATP-dependent RNA helicase RhlE
MPLRKLFSLFKRKKKEEPKHKSETPEKTAHSGQRLYSAGATHERYTGGSHQGSSHTQHKPQQHIQPLWTQAEQRQAQQQRGARPAQRPVQHTARPATQPVQSHRPPVAAPSRPVTHAPVPARPVHHMPPAARPHKPASDLPQLRFDQLGLAPNLLKAVIEEGYTEPTPIQQQAIPVALAGKDIFGCAQTGTGKTAAFALPILQKLSRPDVTNQQFRAIHALIVTPTRELAAQIGESFNAYGRHTGLKYGVIYGGVYQGLQEKAMRGGVNILVATPGRLLDLLNQKLIFLNKVEILVLDEADRMLDMGFINDIRKIVAKVPIRRQTLFFSATMPSEILSLANTILDNPVTISVTPETSAAETVEQSVYFVEKDDKPELLRHLLEDSAVSRALVFTRTKSRADRVARKLAGWGIPAQAIHGDKAQSTREKTLAAFKKGAIRVLVASDVVSRGIDIDDISHVFNFDIPHEPEAYIHRIGRTGRAGASGTAISFCDREERDDLKQIERLLDKSIPVVTDQPYHSTAPAQAPHRAPRQHSGGTHTSHPQAGSRPAQRPARPMGRYRRG